MDTLAGLKHIVSMAIMAFCMYCKWLHRNLLLIPFCLRWGGGLYIIFFYRNFPEFSGSWVKFTGKLIFQNHLPVLTLTDIGVSAHFPFCGQGALVATR